MSSGVGEREPLLSNGARRDSQSRKPDQPVGPKDISKSTRYGILAGVWSATFLSSLNMTLVPTMLPAISSQFHRSNQASWLGTAYLLATCTFTPLYGRLCNVLGRRGANQSAVFFAALGTLMCGLSNSMNMLIFARFLSGVGGGAVFTTSTIVVSDMYSLRSRGLAQGFQAVFNGLGMGLGGPFGGFITDRLGWRAAFLIQVPFFAVSTVLTSAYLRYATPGKGKSTKEVLKRIDYFGSSSLMCAVGGCLFFLAAKYNSLLPWSSAQVIAPLVVSIVSFVAFVILEIYVVPEPVLAPFLLKQRIPVLVGVSNFLVAMCNFAITYFVPMWFQTVMLTSASTAGLHLLPNSIAMSTGSMFAGWLMHRTGRYKALNMIFGIFPFIATVLLWLMYPDMGPIQSWLSIIPLGFGNAVVLQTTLIALLAHLPESHMAVGTGFGQLFRGVGQVGGVAVASAIFQSKLSAELHERIKTPDSEKLITELRKSATYIAQLTPDLQEKAKTSYDISLKAVFAFAACSTFLAYCARFPIPEKSLETRPKSEPPGEPQPRSESDTVRPSSGSDTDEDENEDDSISEREDDQELPQQRTEGAPATLPQRPHQRSVTSGTLRSRSARAGVPVLRPPRRLSMYESADSYMDMESRRTGGSARPQEPTFKNLPGAPSRSV